MDVDLKVIRLMLTALMLRTACMQALFVGGLATFEQLLQPDE